MRFTAIKFSHSLSDNYYARVYVEHRHLKHCQDQPTIHGVLADSD